MSESSLCKQSIFLKDHVLVIITSALIYLKKGYAILQNVHSPRTLNLPYKSRNCFILLVPFTIRVMDSYHFLPCDIFRYPAQNHLGWLLWYCQLTHISVGKRARCSFGIWCQRDRLVCSQANLVEL